MDDFQIAVNAQPFLLSKADQALASKFAKQLWARPNIKQLTIQCIDEGKLWSKRTATPLQKALRNEISRIIDEYSCFQHVKKDLRFIVESMGMRLQLWGDEMIENGKFSVDMGLYIDHIRWTKSGSIDTAETIRVMYFSKLLPVNSETWIELCELCLEDCITDLWPKVSEIEKSRDKNSHSTLSFYWTYRMQNRLNEQLGDFTSKMSNYSIQYSLEMNAFIDVFTRGNYAAVKYFWKLLDDGERNTAIIIVVNNLIIFSQSQLINIFQDTNDALEFALFLMQQLSSYDADDLWIQLMENEDLLVQMLKWPLHDLFLEALDQLWKKNVHIDYTSILLWLLDSIDSLHSTDGAETLYRRIFCQVWENLINEFRGYVDFVDIICTLCSMREIRWLDYIINDERLETSRMALVHYVEQCFSESSQSSDAEFFEEFIQEVLVSDEERENFRAQVVNNLQSPGVVIEYMDVPLD